MLLFLIFLTEVATIGSFHDSSEPQCLARGEILEFIRLEFQTRRSLKVFSVTVKLQSFPVDGITVVRTALVHERSPAVAERCWRYVQRFNRANRRKQGLKVLAHVRLRLQCCRFWRSGQWFGCQFKYTQTDSLVKEIHHPKFPKSALFRVSAFSVLNLAYSVVLFWFPWLLQNGLNRSGIG